MRVKTLTSDDEDGGGREKREGGGGGGGDNHWAFPSFIGIGIDMYELCFPVPVTPGKLRSSILEPPPRS